MTESAWPLLIYAGLGILVVLGIFLGAARFVSAARKGNARFKWGWRVPRDQR